MPLLNKDRPAPTSRAVDFGVHNATSTKSKSQPLPSTTDNGEIETSANPEINISFEERDRNLTLDVLVASWILLVLRFRRESFEKLTWGLVPYSADSTQCLQPEQLGLSELDSAQDLLEKVRKTRSERICWGQDQSQALFFNDGSIDAVRTFQKRHDVPADIEN
jgi:hypothetical protein